MKARNSEYELEYFMASVGRIVKNGDWDTALHTIEERALALTPVAVSFDDDPKLLRALGFSV